MFFYLVMLGVYMGWVESVYPKREPPDDDDTPNTLPEIPAFYRRLPPIPVIEPDDTPLLADAYLRAGGGG